MVSESASDLTFPPPVSEYLAVIRRRAWIVLGVTALVFGIGFGRAVRQARVYRASGQLVLASAGNDPTALQTQMGIVESDAVHALAARRVPGIGSVRAQQDGLGNVITVSADSAHPEVAAATVNSTITAYLRFAQQQSNSQFVSASSAIRGRVANLQRQIDAVTAAIQSGRAQPGNDLVARRDALIAQQSALQQRLDDLQVSSATGTGISVLARATTPTHPIKPTVRDDALIALGAGLLLGIALALAIEFLGSGGSSNSKRPTETSTDLVPLAPPDVRVMGVLPPGASPAGEVVSLSEPESAAARTYRSLNDAAWFLGLERGRCLMVTSTPDRGGKTETITNLAVVLARSRRRVIVVDCDLREPHVHEFFGLPNEIGLSSVLRGETLADALRPVPGVDHLYALTSGPVHADPGGLLASAQCREVLSSLLVGGTLVLLDTAPLGPFEDAYSLAMAAPIDAIMLVTTPEAEADGHLREALDRLRESGARQIGVVLTNGDFASEHEPFRSWPRHRPNGAGSNGGSGSNGGAALNGGFRPQDDTERWAALLGVVGPNPDAVDVTDDRGPAPHGRPSLGASGGSATSTG